MQPIVLRRSFTVASTICVLTLAMLSTFTCSSKAQTGRNGEPFLTLQLRGAYFSPAAASMRGTRADFVTQTQQSPYYNSLKYPFGDANVFGEDLGLEAAYRFSKSNYGLYLGLHLGGFMSAGTANGMISADTAFLALGTISGGLEYYLDMTSSLDLRPRIGLNTSIIGGEYDYHGYPFSINKTERVGIELGASLDWKPLSIFVFSFQASYTNANLMGKSYTARTSGITLANYELNDGVDPADATDASRSIAFFSVGLAAGVVF